VYFGSHQRKQKMSGQRGTIATASDAVRTTCSAVSRANLQVRVLRFCPQF